jgi:hypothetical protein
MSIITVAFCDKDDHVMAYAIGSANDRELLVEDAARARNKFVKEYPRVQMNPKPVIL